MKEQPLISIIISTYNRANYLKRAVESILKQAYKNIELIIVDNGSIDKTFKIISEFSQKDTRIKIIINRINLGRGKSSNKGIRKARGKYIARLDDDDYWADPKKLEKQVKFLESHADYVLAGGGMISINETGQELFRYLFPENDEDIKKSILSDNLFAHGSVIFRKDAWEKVGGYNEEFDFPEDWDLYLKLGKLGKFYNFQEYFLYYLQGQQNISNFNIRRIRRNLKLNIKLRKKYRNDYPNFWKAFLLGWAYYLYSFLPFKKQFHPIFSKLRKAIFDQSVCKQIKTEE